MSEARTKRRTRQRYFDKVKEIALQFHNEVMKKNIETSSEEYKTIFKTYREKWRNWCVEQKGLKPNLNLFETYINLCK